jgi:hypothetical protein
MRDGELAERRLSGKPLDAPDDGRSGILALRGRSPKVRCTNRAVRMPAL